MFAASEEFPLTMCHMSVCLMYLCIRILCMLVCKYAGMCVYDVYDEGAIEVSHEIRFRLDFGPLKAVHHNDQTRWM